MNHVFSYLKSEFCPIKREKTCIDLMEYTIEGSGFCFSLNKIDGMCKFIEIADYPRIAHFTKVLALLVLDIKKSRNPFHKCT